MVRFLLHRESPVVDAPSIGPNLAEKLQGVGVSTVDSLLAADPESLATELQHPRIDAATIARWQQQAGLVCRIPLLSGDHARLLVASEVTSLDDLAKADAAGLHETLARTARGNQGKRILRGTVPPDVKQVKQWIRWARNQRSLRAA
jgi:predicted RecB family nuclease